MARVGKLKLTEPRDHQDLTRQLNKILSELEQTVNSNEPVATAATTTTSTTTVSSDPPFPTTTPTGSGGPGAAAPADASYITATAEPGLNFERVLTGGSNITITDNGPNNTIVIDAVLPASNQALNVISVTFTDSPVTVSRDTTEWTYYRGNATSGAIIFNLPRAVGSGMVVGFAKLDSTANALTPTAFAGDNINDLGTYTLNTQRSVVWLADVVAGSWDVIIYTPLA